MGGARATRELIDCTISMITPGVAQGLVLTRARAPQNGRAPLHCAAWNGNLEVARALLEARADITAKTMVSEGGVGGEGQRIRESRDFGGS